MQVAVLGLGYVGCTTAACLSYKGINVVGIDIHQEKVDLINSGKGTFKEDLVHELISSAISKGTLKATTDQAALESSDVIFVCVGTPSVSDGSPNLQALESCCKQIGEMIKTSSKVHTIVIRSTIPPGTIESKLIPILESNSNKKAFSDFDVCMNPEFMREGTSVHDFTYPSRLIIGAKTDASVELLKKVYRDVKAPLQITDIKTAEFIKYVDNSFHALKVAYANEIANMCKDLDINSKQIFDLFLSDKKLNISEAYLRPGPPFGGSCLPKEVRAFKNLSPNQEKYPIVHSILPSNERRKREIIDFIDSYGKLKIGILGIAFKEGTDDMRESPMLDIAKRLKDKGYALTIYDANIDEKTILPLNKKFIETVFPSLFSHFCTNIQELAQNSELIVVANKDPVYLDILEHLTNDHIVLDYHDIIDSSEHKDKITPLWR